MYGLVLPKNVTGLKLLHIDMLEGNNQKRSYNVLSNERSIGILEVKGYVTLAEFLNKVDPFAFQPVDEIFTPSN
jgi:hypothetical protein